METERFVELFDDVRWNAPNPRTHALNSGRAHLLCLSVSGPMALPVLSSAWHLGRVSVAPDPESAEVIYGRMRWNTPLSENHADLLLDRMRLAEGDQILDLGCGWGELLLRAVARVPDATGTGVDHDAWAL